MSTLRYIWETAYAVAFVGEFQRTHDHATQVPAHERRRLNPERYTPPHEFEAPFDTAVRTTTAEAACDIADHAVYEYHRWNRQECDGDPVNARILELLIKEKCEKCGQFFEDHSGAPTAPPTCEDCT